MVMLSRGEIPDIQIITTALSLGPCMPKHILEEMAVPTTPDNEQRVVDALIASHFDQHGAFWSH
jgi:hypothetical protein